MPKVKSRKYRRRRGGNPGDPAPPAAGTEGTAPPAATAPLVEGTAPPLVEAQSSTNNNPSNSNGKNLLITAHVEQRKKEKIPTVVAELVEEPVAERVEPSAPPREDSQEITEQPVKTGGYRKSRKSRRKKGKSRKRKMKSRRYKR